MHNGFENILEEFKGIDPQKILDLMAEGEVKQLSAGEHFLEAGARSSQTAIVLSGLFRIYRILDTGVESTIAFVVEKGAIGSVRSIKADAPVLEYIQALEDSTVIAFNEGVAKEMALNDPELARFYIGMLEERLYYAVERHNMFNLNSPEERYKWMLENEGHLVNRVKQQYLATYLGIIPSSFSRIKKRVLDGRG